MVSVCPDETDIDPDPVNVNSIFAVTVTLAATVVVAGISITACVDDPIAATAVAILFAYAVTLLLPVRDLKKESIVTAFDSGVPNGSITTYTRSVGLVVVTVDNEETF